MLFRSSELLYPYYRLREEGVEVDVAAPQVGPIAGKHGYSVRANVSFDDLTSDPYDLLIIPGGKAPETVRLSDRAVAVAREMMAADKIVAAICHGAQLLMSAGVLDGRRATCWQGIRDDLRNAGADYADEEVVVDGSLITSRCPSDLPWFCGEIVRAVRNLD